MHHQCRLSLLCSPQESDTNSTSSVWPISYVVILQEASDHAPLVSDQFVTYTGGTDLAILLNRSAFEPGAAVAVINEFSTSQDTWGMVALVVRGLLRRPSLSGAPTLTSCSVHVDNVVAKKRDASTSLLQAPRAHVLQHNVDFIGGYFNMCAFSYVAHVFADQGFAAPGSSLLWWPTQSMSEQGSSSCQNTRTDGALTLTAATSSTMRNWALDHEINQRTLPVFLLLRSTNIPCPSSRLERAAGRSPRVMQIHESSLPALSETPWFFSLGCCSPGKHGLCAQHPAPPGFPPP